ncbi:Zinc knuckle CX2CX4HX4C [Abeliophyllum distichum]|uniref:Zinc knuckle CX2CX4HX4C n=1 Tax=Abeliophyllum distichum TaxID=126358 RepID=A0ABD1UHC9_9LAMI
MASTIFESDFRRRSRRGGVLNRRRRRRRSVSAGVGRLNVPPGLRDENNIREWGAAMGTVEVVDLSGPSMRIRVLVDVSKPLNHGVQIHIEELRLEVTLLIQFESLPDYCYAYGLIGHHFADCDKMIGDQTIRAPSFNQEEENEMMDGDINERQGDEDIELNKVVTEKDVCINEITAEWRDDNEVFEEVLEQEENTELLDEMNM